MISKLISIRLKLLWFKKSYSFRWAHKPLCDRYKNDVFHFGKMKICRSCFLLYAGLILSLLQLFFLQPVTSMMYVVSGLAVVTLVMSYPKWYKKLPRNLRDVLRFSVGWSMGSFAVLSFIFDPLIGLVAFPVFYVFWKVYLAQRKSRKIGECDNCKEVEAGGVCSGFATQAEICREYEEEATGIIMSGNYVPVCKQSKSKREIK